MFLAFHGVLSFHRSEGGGDARPALTVTIEKKGLPARWPERPAAAARVIWSVLRRVELTLDPAADVARPLDLRQSLVEHELGDARGRRHFRLQDVGLAREQHAPGAEIRADLVGARLGRGDEALVGDPLGA